MINIDGDTTESYRYSKGRGRPQTGNTQGPEERESKPSNIHDSDSVSPTR